MVAQVTCHTVTQPKPLYMHVMLRMYSYVWERFRDSTMFIVDFSTIKQKCTGVKVSCRTMTKFV